MWTQYKVDPLRTSLTLAIGLLAVSAGVCAPPGTVLAGNDESFRRELQELADRHRLPAYSAVLIQDGEIQWSIGSGDADLEAGTPASADTPYRIASLTKPIAAVVLMQLVESGALDLDAPMRDFDVLPWFEPGGGSWAHYPSRYEDGAITVRHVLTHTSESDPPGESYKYSGNIFADLTWVVESVTAQSYPDVVTRRILDPLGMTRSAPGMLVPSRQSVVRVLARPYQLKDGEPVPATYPGFGLDPDVDVAPWNLEPAFRLPSDTQAVRRRRLGEAFTPLFSAQTAAGMLASVNDLAKFDIAFDGGRLVSATTRDEMLTAARTSEGDNLPYGLGWFVEEWDGMKVAWHYGWFPPTVSGLYVKIPQTRLTFIILSNCDALSAGVAWSALGVRASPYARLFFDHYAPLRK